MTRTVSFAHMEQPALAGGVETGHLRNLFERKEYQTPLLVLSRSEIGRNYRRLKEALPRAEIHYAVKPNIHPAILEEVIAGGGSFDVCSAGEIKTVTALGIDPTTLIHSHPIKSPSEFDFAVAEGVEIFVVDNPEEIKKLRRYGNRKLKILIRYRINTNTSAVVNLQYKFGCAVNEVLPLARLVKETGHEFYGLCFHIGSQCIYPGNYAKAIETAHSLINRLDLAGLDTRLLDIGGGFPVKYVKPIPPIDEFCSPIRKALDKQIRPGIRIASEPGRFIAASPVTLVCSVVGKARRDGKTWYYLDDGLYSTFSGIVYDSCLYPVITERTGKQTLSVLAGPTCDSFDVMYDGVMLPEHEVGDRILFAATGAYCQVSGSSFNALRRPEYLVIE